MSNRYSDVEGIRVPRDRVRALETEDSITQSMSSPASFCVYLKGIELGGLGVPAGLLRIQANRSERLSFRTNFCSSQLIESTTKCLHIPKDVSSQNIS